MFTRMLGLSGALVIASSLAAPRALALTDGAADGTLTVAGKVTKLTRAYAVATKGAFDKTKEDVVVILCDAPLTEAQLTDDFERIHLVDAGKLHTVEMTIDAGKKPISVSVRHNTFKASGGGFSSSDLFEPKTFDGKTAEGKIYRKEPGKWFGDIPYTYSATFRATVYRKPRSVPPSAGDSAAAAKSPEADAYRAMQKAIAAGDLAGLKKTMVSERAKELDDPKAKEMLGFIKMMAPSDVRILKVTEKGDTAVLLLSGKQDGKDASGTVDLKKEGGAWKVSKESWKSE